VDLRIMDSSTFYYRYVTLSIFEVEGSSMRIAELSRAAEVPVPTIKYYLREGLLPPGELTSPNQAQYGQLHLERLRLVRALVEVGRLPIATIRELLADLERPDPDLHHILGCSLKPTSDLIDREGPSAASAEVDELIERRGWHVGSEAPARRVVAEVLTAMRQLDADDLAARLDDYAAVAEQIAAIDLDSVGRRGEPAAILYGAVVGTVLGDTLIAGLRRLAQENASARQFGHREA